jgi:hypothetical protein
MILELAVRCTSVLLLVAAPVVAQSKYGDVVPSLAEMRSHNRPLIVFFSSTEPDSQLQQQMKIFREHRKELNDRDVVVVMTEDDALNLRRHPSLNVLRRKFHVEVGSFTVVLLGKDGGEKFRSHDPVTIEKLDALIDAMPMRQQEVRDGHHPE